MTIETIPLAQLEVAPENPRKSVSPEHIDRLAANIRAVGLKQNLVGYDGGDGVYYITAGGCRLLALQKLAEETDQGEIPVMLEAKEDAIATAISENYVRSAMDTVDQLRAWKRLHDEGYTSDAIIKAFQIERKLYDRTMRLASVPEEILDALKDGEIAFDHATAFAIPEPEEALRVFHQLKKDGKTFTTGYTGPEGVMPHQLRRMFVEERVHGNNRLAKFVGREAYEAEGGTITEDLFGEDVFFDDRDKLVSLAEHELRQIAATYEHEWAWVETTVEEFDFHAKRNYGRIYPDEVSTLTEAEAKELDELRDNVEQGEVLNEKDERRLDELTDKECTEVWPEGISEVAGIVVGIGYDGTVATFEGFVKPEDCERAVEMGLMQPNRHQPEPTSKPKGEDGWPASVVADMRRIEVWAMRNELVEKPQVLLKLLASDFSNTFGHGFNFGYPEAPDEKLAEQGLTVNKKLLEPTELIPAAEAMDMKQGEVNKRLAVELARRVTGFSQVVWPDIRKWWTPNEAFLKRLGKAQLIEVACDLGMGQLRQWNELKKGQILGILTPIFAGEKKRALEVAGSANSEAEAIIAGAVELAKTWLPRVMQPVETEEGEAGEQSDEHQEAA